LVGQVPPSALVKIDQKSPACHYLMSKA
jgi:hypothetical protein